jgi:hypothetical protein
VSFYIVTIALLLLIPTVIAISYVAAKVAQRKENERLVHKHVPRKFEPTTLDRSPEMPHRTDATS